MKNKWYAYVALGCAIWFALTAWIWTYLINIVLSYPFGLIALAMYFRNKKNAPENQMNKWILIMLIGGWIVSILAFMLFL